MLMERKKIFKLVNRERQRFRGVKIYKILLTVVHNRVKYIFTITIEFDFIGPIRLTIQTGVVVSPPQIPNRELMPSGSLLIKIRNRIGSRIEPQATHALRENANQEELKINFIRQLIINIESTSPPPKKYRKKKPNPSNFENSVKPLDTLFHQ